MFATETVPGPVRRAVAAWVGRLADRLAALRNEIRDGVVEAAGRTFAEAVEAALRTAFPAGRPPGSTFPGRDFPPACYDDPGNPWGDDAPVPVPPPAPRRSWRTVAVAGLHALAWWLRRHAPSPVFAAAAAAAGAAVLLID